MSVCFFLYPAVDLFLGQYKYPPTFTASEVGHSDKMAGCKCSKQRAGFRTEPRRAPSHRASETQPTGHHGNSVSRELLTSAHTHTHNPVLITSHYFTLTSTRFCPLSPHSLLSSEIKAAASCDVNTVIIWA